MWRKKQFKSDSNCDLRCSAYFIDWTRCSSLCLEQKKTCSSSKKKWTHFHRGKHTSRRNSRDDKPDMTRSRLCGCLHGTRIVLPSRGVHDTRRTVLSDVSPRCSSLLLDIKTHLIPDHSEMVSRRNHYTAASLLILTIRVFRGNTLTCHPAEYQIGNECCPKCPPGGRVVKDCTESRTTSCQPCIEGTFMNHPTGLKQCYRSTNCDPGSGLRIKSSCTTTSDAVCEAQEGFYCTDLTKNSCVAAEKHTRCQPGQYISQKGTASKDTVCSDCRDATFSDGTFTSCQPHTRCESENLQLIKPGTAASDAECEEKSLNVTVIVICAVVLLLVIGLVVVLVVWKIRKHLAALNRNGRTPTERKDHGEEAETMGPL
ncbi:tumor necrosis factor receptor superfamily member 14-like [Seriola aureovittata]|uniref:tumor necrosis factor receptor superfamily member 14-like n=1 Tax=Seriola aureovittata TaxID=2871759 RepID=UPI0024BD7B1D|nr:tumor necrosis factor receptor superfamily member 14-like [Seriola aureovittata]XP_056240317.1 tumor necrosis factor receptor superfamily member 14-like [Seriola aureovittata]